MLMCLLTADADSDAVVKVVTCNFLHEVTIFLFEISILWRDTLRKCRYPVSHPTFVS